MKGKATGEATQLLCVHMPPGCCCVASRCMAWRWDEPPRRRSYFRAVTPMGQELEPDAAEVARPHDVPASWTWSPGDHETAPGWWEPDAEAQQRRTGYCGLAGPLRQLDGDLHEALHQLRELTGVAEHFGNAIAGRTR